MPELGVFQTLSQKVSLKGHYDFDKLLQNLNYQIKNNLNLAKYANIFLFNIEKNTLLMAGQLLKRQFVVQQNTRINTPQKLKFAQTKIQKIVSGDWKFYQDLIKLGQDFNQHYGQKLINVLPQSDRIKCDCGKFYSKQQIQIHLRRKQCNLIYPIKKSQQRQETEKLQQKTKKIFKKQKTEKTNPSPVKSDASLAKNFNVQSDQNYYQDQQ